MKNRGFVDVEDGVDGVSKGSTLVVKSAEVCYGVFGQSTTNYVLLLLPLAYCGLLLAGYSLLLAAMASYGWPGVATVCCRWTEFAAAAGRGSGGEEGVWWGGVDIPLSSDGE